MFKLIRDLLGYSIDKAYFDKTLIRHLDIMKLILNEARFAINLAYQNRNRIIELEKKVQELESKLKDD